MYIFVIFVLVGIFHVNISFIVPSGLEPDCSIKDCTHIDVNKCTCMCLPGSKDRHCLAVLLDTTSNWPAGNYGLPTSLYGCPEEHWESGYINLTLPDNAPDMMWESSGQLFYYGDREYPQFTYNHSTDDLHILGPYSKRTFQFNMCFRGNGKPVINSGLRGNFCVFKTGDKCDSGFEEGSISIKGYKTSSRGFDYNITTYGVTTISFCCVNDTDPFIHNYPYTYPFVMFKGPYSETCDPVLDMDVVEDSLYITKEGVEIQVMGMTPTMTSSETHLKLSFCVYIPIDYSLAITDELGQIPMQEAVSLWKPVYSAPYEEWSFNNPKFVVDGDFGLSTGAFSTVMMHRPWLQIDLQEFIYVDLMVKTESAAPKQPGEELYGFYVSREQWDFLHYGAIACFFGVTQFRFACKRPVLGQYVTLTMEYNHLSSLTLVNEVRVYGLSSGCGRQLGMISGVIKNFQIETSSNHQNIEFTRALQDISGWCSSQIDSEPWIMIDLIVPTTVQGVAVHGWYQNQRMFINSFTVEHGMKRDNLTKYTEGDTPMVFKIDTTQNVYTLQKFWFFNEIVTRYVKLNVVKTDQNVACLKLELIGCTVYRRRNIYCDKKQTSLDFGFASLRFLSYDFEDAPGPRTVCQNSTFDVCQQLTIEKGYIGNFYNGELGTCCFYNISSTNRHFKHLWQSSSSSDAIISERLCFEDFYKPLFMLGHGYGLPPLLGIPINDYSLMYPSDYPKGTTVDVTWVTFGFFLKLTIMFVEFAENATKSYLIQAGNQDINPSYCKDTLTIDVGTENEIVITRDNQERYRYSSFMSTTNIIYAKFRSCFQYITSKETLGYQLQVENIAHPGCGVDGTKSVVCTTRTAYLASYLYPALYTSSDTNSWKIRGKYGQFIELKFIDLDVITKLDVANIVDSFIEVFDLDLKGNKLSMGRFIKDTKPSVSLISNWHMMDIEFRIGNDLRGRGFLGLYTIVDVVTNQLNQSNCNHTWWNFQSNCYKVFSRLLITQKKAEEECVRHGGHLVSITSKEEMTFVHQLLINLSIVDSVYIGLIKINSGDYFSDYSWLNNEPMIYTAWFRDEKNGNIQPDGFVDEQCTAIVFDSIHNINSWHDVPCAYDKIQHFICETSLNTVNSEEQTIIGLSFSHQELLSNHLVRCSNDEIVSKYILCNGHSDCSDNSDELNCDATECTDSQYRCNNGQCIHFSFYCDGRLDCFDGSDENSCEWPSCQEDEWQCGNKQCIPEKSRCDVKIDCTDHSDEYLCESCSSSVYQCYSSSCISQNRICDMSPDCPGRYLEDENGCQTSNKQYSCEDWWKIGARVDGIYLIDYGTSDPHRVLCQFAETLDQVFITTSFYYEDISQMKSSIGLADTKSVIFVFPKNLITLAVRSEKANVCSQNLMLRCFFHETFTKDVLGYYPKVILDACNKSSSCNCVGGVDWSRADVNKVWTDNITITDHDSLPFNGYEIISTSYSQEGFYTIDVGPVVCISETFKNTSSHNLLCDSGKLFDHNDKCKLKFDHYGDILGCRDLSHLQGCEKFICPEGYFKCTEGHCLAPELVCDGRSHCRGGEDEHVCNNMTCPGMFRCQMSSTCLLLGNICDDVIQCFHGDDELFCNLTCPDNCTCDGEIITCHQLRFEQILMNISDQARKLDISQSIFVDNKIGVQHFLSFPYLAELIISSSDIEVIEPFSFKNLNNLILLDLSRNKLKILKKYTFDGLHRLVTLKLQKNYALTQIEPNAFVSLTNIVELKLTGTSLSKIQDDTFQGLDNLHHLNISGNGINAINSNGFRGMTSLQSIDMSNNYITEFTLDIFSTLSRLTDMNTDSYVFCCLKPLTVEDGKCFPQMDEFSSCTDLMRSDVLRVFLWMIGISALLGNIGVIIYRTLYERQKIGKPHGLYVLNLSLSDMMMGVYLCIIAVADMFYRGDYILHDNKWRTSVTCKLAGVIAVISSEASVNFIFLITLECFLTIKYPFGNRKISPRTSRVSVLFSWFMVSIIGIFPVLYPSYFSDEYYSKTAVCLALPISRQRIDGWEYSMMIFVFYNCLVFLVVACCQLYVYNAAKSSNRIMAKRAKNDLALAHRLFLVVFTDFLCWFPISVMGILALTGEVFPSEVYSWVAVFVMPVNAALNPFLYTFSAIVTKKKPELLSTVSDKMFNISKYKRNRKGTEGSRQLLLASSFIESSRELTMDHLTLKSFLRSTKLSPRRSYILLHQLTSAIAFLHQKFLTVREPITVDNVVVFIDNGMIIRVKIVSRVRDVVEQMDTMRDVECIGLITKQMLRYTSSPRNNNRN